MRFLLDRPAFARFVTWEELAGGGRLRAATGNNTALQDAFTQVKSVARRRGLASFQVDDAVLLFISLTFSPMTQQHTFLASLERDLSDLQVRKRHIKLAVDQMMHLFGASA